MREKYSNGDYSDPSLDNFISNHYNPHNQNSYNNTTNYSNHNNDNNFISNLENGVNQSCHL